MSYRGKYKPNRPDKYHGDPTKIIYRSLWERKCMKIFDSNPNILSWGSEEISIPYVSPVDGKIHRYYPDFIVELMDKEGKINTIIIEVKPSKQVKEPSKPSSGKITRKYISEVMTYSINDAKWKAAQTACDARGWKFRILTEKEIF